MDQESPALESITLERHMISPGVRRIPIKIGRIRGFLFIPPGDGPFPGVIDIYGGQGGVDEHRAGKKNAK